MITVVAALIVGPDGRTLMVRKQGTDIFMNPGGKPEPHEPEPLALRRELIEELDLDLPVEVFQPLGTYLTDAANEPGERLHATCFRIDLGDQPHRIGAEIVESRWIDPTVEPDVPLAPLAVDFLLPLLNK